MIIQDSSSAFRIALHDASTAANGECVWGSDVSSIMDQHRAITKCMELIKKQMADNLPITCLRKLNQMHEICIKARVPNEIKEQMGKFAAEAKQMFAELTNEDRVFRRAMKEQANIAAASAPVVLLQINAAQAYANIDVDVDTSEEDLRIADLKRKLEDLHIRKQESEKRRALNEAEHKRVQTDLDLNRKKIALLTQQCNDVAAERARISRLKTQVANLGKELIELRKMFIESF